MNNTIRIQEHTLKNQVIYVGLEDSKKSWKLCIRSLGKVVKEASIPADYSNLRAYFHRHFPECAISVIYEAGFSGFNLYDQIGADGWRCIVTPPNKVTQEKSQRLKNDRIDSRRLARVLETGDYHLCYVPDKELREDRQISRCYEQNLKDIRQTCNRFRRLLEYHGLDRLFTPGRWTPKKYRDAWDALESMDVSESLRIAIEESRMKMEYLWETKKRLLGHLKRLSRDQKYRENVDLLVSVPGIGWLTAIRFMLEIGSIDRFPRKEQFSRYLGLVPSEYSSGETERKGHITKEGSRFIRSWLIECSWIAIKKDPALLDKFRRVLSHSGSSKIAIVAVARSLAIRIRSILVSKEAYMPGRVG